MVTQNLSVASTGVVRFHVDKIKKFLLVQFLKQQPNHVSARLALTPGP